VDGGYKCSICGKNYPLKDNISVFMDDKGGDCDTFPEELFERLRKVEDNHFWYRGRNRIIETMLAKHLPRRDSTVLEVGCGTGYVSSLIKSMGYSVDCADLMLEGLKYCKSRCVGIRLFQFDLYKVPFRGHYDCVCAFDVIEHIEDDLLALRNIAEALKPGGFFFMTVPAYGFLWSSSDDYKRHKRRYSSQQLKSKIELAGMEIIRKSHFMMFLLPFMFLSRFFLKNELKDEIRINPILNHVFFYALVLELYLMRYIDLPFGSSILFVAKRNGGKGL
jgi:SAM-dependent methyltransferase